MKLTVIKTVKAVKVSSASIFTVMMCALNFTLSMSVHATTAAVQDYRLSEAVSYGNALVTKIGKPESRKLWMDVYQPATAAGELRPAVILSFGGAFHRGGPRHTFQEGDVKDTSMGDYCRKFAAKGYVCFAVDYRLAPELPVLKSPVPASLEINQQVVLGTMGRVNLVRGIMGLDLLRPKNSDDAALLRGSMNAAINDVTAAVGHVRESAQHYGVDPERIVLGGFSSGAMTSFAVAASGAPVKGVFMLSGASVLKSLKLSVNSPKVLIIQGQNDLAGIRYSAPLLLKYLQHVKTPYEFAWVPSAGHFYTASSPSLSGDATIKTVEERIVGFLKATIGE